jgi:hypothetical protein
MYNLDVYVNNKENPSAKIRPLTMKREWMHENTYNCDPVGMANTLGYGIYFEEDISFMWNGSRADGAVGIIGSNNIWVGRGEGTVSFVTNLLFKTDENTSVITMPVPNEYLEGAHVLSTVLSTSVFTGSFSVVWKLDTPNKEYFVPAGTNIACILPISLGSIQDSVVTIKDTFAPYERIHDNLDYISYLKGLNAKGIRPRMYKKGIDHLGNVIGKHEVSKIKLHVNYEKDIKDGR